ncbi:MAG TPA: MATE family efflux transporter, partial [Lentisphaeria bacterium]|nr:MATE family efflux transporter [Lentisphaeria bacterium]
MGIQGAAIATVVSQFISALVVLVILARRHGLILLSGMPFPILKTTWAVIIRYAVPSTIGML